MTVPNLRRNFTVQPANISRMHGLDISELETPQVLSLCNMFQHLPLHSTNVC